MAYIFEENNFKGYLRKNATKSWFSKQYDNVRYEAYGNYISNADKCSSDYTIRVKDVLSYPTLGQNLEIAGAVGVMGTGMAGFGIGVILAPVTFGASLAVGASAVVGSLGSAAMISNSDRPRDIYFTITSDNSEWVAEKIEKRRGVDELADKICRWSNDVYEDKFETHAYQETSKW